ncbi:MAG TPA: hypothetical protein VK801_12500 [Caulobacteraceae bacterium]|nr:hypothetical protein [Caulobacteraceae bacterium]
MPILSGDRPLCFLHIAKTGGTSLTDALARLYPPDRVSTDGGSLSVEYLRGLNDRLSGRAFVVGHAGPGVAEFLQGRADLITVLRRPADQAVSHYLHVLADPGHELHTEAMRGSFSEFLRRNDGLIDFQTASLCVALTGDAARADAIRSLNLEPLLQFLDALPFVGVTERAQACGEVLSHIFPSGDSVALACLNAAVSRGVSARTLDRLRHEYDALKDDPRLAPIFAREAIVHARAAACLARLERRATQAGARTGHARKSETISASRFSTRHGEILGSAIVCRLPEGANHLVHGPYGRLAAGCYQVEFRLSVHDAAPGPSPRIQLETVSNGVVSLRRRWIGAKTAGQTRTLHFINDAASNVLEFRIRTRGFTKGQLIFQGVTVCRSTIWRTWPSMFTRLVSQARRWLSRRVARLEARRTTLAPDRAT